MNTLFEYMYRDASNYKKFETVILQGELSFKDLEPYLYGGEFFIPSVVGLKDLQNLPFGEDDHIWHSIVAITKTDLQPITKISSKQLITKFKNAYEKDWHEYDVYYKLMKNEDLYIDLVGEFDDMCPNCGECYYIWKNSSGELQCDNCGYSETE